MTLMINDLETNKELDRAAMKTVCGGFLFGAAGGQMAGQSVGGGGFFSPTVGVNTALNLPVIIQLDLDLSNVIASANTDIVS